MVDSTDPIGPAVGLFEEDFYKLVFSALKEDGIMVAPERVPLLPRGNPEEHVPQPAQRFPDCRGLYQAFIPTYPSGFWSFAFASKKYHPVRDFDRERAAKRPFYTRYYNEDLHLGAFMLPTFAKENISE